MLQPPTNAGGGLPGHIAVVPNAAWMLWQTAESSPEHPALVDRERSATYGTLRARAAAVAEALIADGVKPGDRVGILLDRGVDAAAAFFGVLASGGIAVNINETLRTLQIDFILGHAGAVTLLSTESILARLPRALESPVRMLRVEDVPASGTMRPVPRVAHDVGHIIYTSGSTGQPKGVTITHGNLWAGMWSVSTYLRIAPTDRIASLLPFSFDYGLNQLLLAAGRGATLVIERSPLPQQIVATLATESITVLPCVPPLWLQLIATEGFRARALPALRAMTNTGGRVPREAVHALRTAQPQAELFLMYGLTEAFRSTYLPPSEVDRRPDSIGRAIPGAEILVLREDGTLCDAEEIGELVHRGPTVGLGYWRDPETTARVYRPNPLRPPGTPDTERVVFSGDLVRRDAEGFIYHVGRRDKMIKSLGFRVSPDEVASAIFASGQVAEVVVTSEDDEARGERIIAHVVLAADGTLDRLKVFCGTEMPRYMQPGRIEVHETLPRTSSGKHDPKQLAGARATVK
jgi:amino acid adenylation domain-containing protein